MNITEWLEAVGSVATACALFVALWAGTVAAKHAKKAARQSEAYAGAEAAIAWRTQVFDLHDRGLDAGQIRFIMHLEDGGEGYEGWNGGIDDLVQNLPRSSGAVVAGSVDRPSCPTMPTARDGCAGPCRNALESSGSGAYRSTDSGSPNESAGN